MKINIKFSYWIDTSACNIRSNYVGCSNLIRDRRVIFNLHPIISLNLYFYLAYSFKLTYRDETIALSLSDIELPDNLAYNKSDSDKKLDEIAKQIIDNNSSEITAWLLEKITRKHDKRAKA